MSREIRNGSPTESGKKNKRSKKEPNIPAIIAGGTAAIGLTAALGIRAIEKTFESTPLEAPPSHEKKIENAGIPDIPPEIKFTKTDTTTIASGAESEDATLDQLIDELMAYFIKQKLPMNVIYAKESNEIRFYGKEGYLMSVQPDIARGKFTINNFFIPKDAAKSILYESAMRVRRFEMQVSDPNKIKDLTVAFQKMSDAYEAELPPFDAELKTVEEEFERIRTKESPDNKDRLFKANNQRFISAVGRQAEHRAAFIRDLEALVDKFAE